MRAAVRAGQGHSGWLTGASISHDGGQAVTTSGDGSALLWDLATGEQLRVLEGHSAEVSASLMTRKGRCVFRAVGGGAEKTDK